MLSISLDDKTVSVYNRIWWFTIDAAIWATYDIQVYIDHVEIKLVLYYITIATILSRAFGESIVP